MKETERVVAGPGPGRGPFGGGMVGQKSMSFGPSAKRLAGRMAPDRGKAVAVAAARRRQRRAERPRAADPRPRHRPDLRRAVRPAAAGRHHQGRRRRRAPGPRRRQARRHARRHGRRARAGRRLHRGRARAAARARGLRRLLAAGLAAGLPPQRRRAEHRPTDALGRRGEGQPAAAELLRQAAPRRAAVPGHQRHRQRQPDPPADDEPAARLAAHRGRRAVDDVLDLADRWRWSRWSRCRCRWS